MAQLHLPVEMLWLEHWFLLLNQRTENTQAIARWALWTWCSRINLLALTFQHTDALPLVASNPWPLAGYVWPSHTGVDEENKLVTPLLLISLNVTNVTLMSAR